MNFIEQMQDMAKHAPKRVVFPESTEAHILETAAKISELGIGIPVLVGSPEEIEQAAKKLNIKTDVFEILDNTNEEKKQELIRQYLSISDMYSEKSLNRKCKDALNFAACAVKVGWADCLAAGYVHATGDVVMAAQMFIGMQEGISTVSSLGIVEFPNWNGPQKNFLAFTDCAVQPRPTSEELADIAIASADTVSRLLGWEARVAMLSFSTKGSAAHDDVDVVANAVQIARQKRPTLLVDGEFQIDSAIIPAVAMKKVKDESAVAGKANVLVFPNLGAGNIAVKMTQIFAGAVAYGPMLQGFAKPVTDFSRSAPVEEMVGNVAMLIVRSQEK